ncbi:MAG: cytochrome c3 family protein [Proteobacteria bacterium]|nr:cytochrome c3 family protein [Pseudomonadota bacterium]
MVFATGFAAGSGAMAQAAGQTKLSAEDAELVKKATADVAMPTHLAGIHVNKLKLDCKACHRDNPVPDDTASKVNASCITCHGGYDKMAEVSKKKGKNPDINAHGSHLGPEIGCTTCHQGHKESKTYCLYCHTNFDLPIPGGTAKK